MGFEFEFAVHLEAGPSWADVTVPDEKTTVHTVAIIPLRMIAPIILRGRAERIRGSMAD
jgi:hypothetical protein